MLIDFREVFPWRNMLPLILERSYDLQGHICYYHLLSSKIQQALMIPNVFGCICSGVDWVFGMVPLDAPILECHFFCQHISPDFRECHFDAFSEKIELHRTTNKENT